MNRYYRSKFTNEVYVLSVIVTIDYLFLDKRVREYHLNHLTEDIELVLEFNELVSNFEEISEDLINER